MFEATTLSAVCDLHARFGKIDAKPNTLLAALNATLGEPMSWDGATPLAECDMIKLRAEAEDCGHTAAMQEAKQAVSTAVRQTLHTTRNVVTPHLRSVIARFDEAMKGHQQAAVSPYNIVRVSTPEIYSDTLVDDIVEANKRGITPSPLADKIQVGNYDREALMRLLQVTEERDFNQQLRELVTEGNCVNRIIDTLAGRVSASELLKYNPELALPLYVILKAIDMPTEGVALTQQQWLVGKGSMTTFAANMITKVRNRLDNVLKYNILYDVTRPKKDKVIYVNEEVFLSMQEKGLTANALIGHELLGRKFTTEALIEKLPVLEEAYTREVKLLDQAFRVKKQDATLLAIIKAVRDDANDRCTNDKYVLEGDSKEKVMGRTVEVLERLTTGTKRGSDPITLITAAILLIWYQHTDVPRLLDYALDIEQSTPELAGKQMEIMTLATVRYVVAYVVSMMASKG